MIPLSPTSSSPAAATERQQEMSSSEAEAARDDQLQEGESFYEENGVRILIRDGSYCKPRRSLTAYNFFFQEERRKMIEKEAERQKGKPKIGFASMARAVSSLWKQIDPEERKVYEALAAKDKIRYTSEMKLYKKLEKQLVKQHKKLQKEKEQAAQRQKSPTPVSPGEEKPKTKELPKSKPITLNRPVPVQSSASNSSPSVAPLLNQSAKTAALKQLEDSLQATLQAHEKAFSPSVMNSCAPQLPMNLVSNAVPFSFGNQSRPQLPQLPSSLVPMMQQSSNKSPMPLKEILEQVQDITADLDDYALDFDPFEMEAMPPINPAIFTEQPLQQPMTTFAAPPQLQPLALPQPLSAPPASVLGAPNGGQPQSGGYMTNLAFDLGNECADMFIDMFR